MKEGFSVLSADPSCVTFENLDLFSFHISLLAPDRFSAVLFFF